jgi:amino acid transporter
MARQRHAAGEFSVQQFVSRLRLFFFGNPLASSVQLEHRLPILLALPVFASDALSSVAYATQEILLQFESLGFVEAARHFLIPLSLAIAVLILIVGFSYRQAIHLYPSGGGSYSVARDNLGVLAGVVAASALTIDYVLTVAVSVSSGVENLAAAVKPLHGTLHLLGYAIPLTIVTAVVLVLFIMVINLRGTRESGWLFAVPAYGFVTMLTLVLGTALYRFVTGQGSAAEPAQLAIVESTTQTVGTLVILRAFSSGCSALTGVEAVSNGVSAFEPPEAKNAAKTLLILIFVLVTLFLGLGFAAHYYRVLPTETDTVISQVARGSFGYGPGGSVLYLLMTLATLSVLMIAANTSFAGFPRLLALVAKDGHAPKTFTSLGDRLVHNRGILALTGASILLIIAFQAKTNSLIPLYAVGVFICFTLSQLGMVRKVRTEKAPGWQRMMVINLFGATITGCVALVQAVSKFTEGAWMVVVVLPILIAFSYLVNTHYVWFDRTMTVEDDDYNPLADPLEPLTVLVLVSSDIHRGILEGLECGRALTGGRPDCVLRAVHIELDPEKTPRLKRKWAKFVEPHLGQSVKLDIVPSPYRWLVEPILDYLDWADLERSGDRVIIVLPEFETGNVITHFLHNFTARRLRSMLLNRPHITVVSSRFFMRPMAWRLGRGGLVY